MHEAIHIISNGNSMATEKRVPTAQWTRFRRAMLVFVALAFTSAITANAGEPRTDAAGAPGRTSPLAGAGLPVAFEDASGLIPFEHAGLQFGGGGLTGAAWFDYNNDGWIDLFLANGKTQPNALFENDGNGGFVNVASVAGVENGLGNAGVIAGDIDNDGWQDLFLTGDGNGFVQSPVKLYRNVNGTFEDITDSSGIVGPLTHGSAVFADINNDGYLDLFIEGIGSLATNTQHANKLFLNNGDLTFTDISVSSGVDTSLGACAAFFSFYDDDPFIDLFVADCNNVNFAPTPIELFKNLDGVTFNNVGPAAGLSPGGFWMGVGPADYDNDGDIDIFVTNLGTTPPGIFKHALYRNNGNGTYTNVAAVANAAAYEFGWGCTFTDFDNDGYADIFFAGSLPGAGFGIIGPGLGNPGTMLFNNGSGGFIDHTSSMPLDLSSHFTSGVAQGDYDNDGFADVVVALTAYGNTSGQPVLYHNLGNDQNWVKLKLEGTTSNRDAVGARVDVAAGALSQTKEVYAGTSFLSMDSQWLTFGIGEAEATDSVTVRWPNGVSETFDNVQAGQTVTLVEGQSQTTIALVGSAPPDGAIDARQPSAPDGSNTAGWDSIMLMFDGDAESVTTSDILVTTNPPGDAPGVIEIIIDGATAAVFLDGPIPVSAWTIVTHVPSESSVHIGYLPGDANGDGIANANDVLFLIDVLNGVVDPVPMWQNDTDRSGLPTANDVLRLIDLLNGAGVYDVYNGATLPD